MRKLSESPLFAEVPREKLFEIRQDVRRRFVPGHTTIFHQGEQGYNFFIIHSGKVRVFRKDGAGVEREVARLGPGESFGELALITGEPRFGSVETLEETTLTVIRKDQFERILRDYPHVVSVLIRKVSGWLYQSNSKLERETEMQYMEVEAVMNKLDKLYIAGSWLHSTLDFQEVLREITDMVITLIGAKSLAIFLVKDKKNELLPAISEGLSPHILPKVKAGRGILGKTAKTGKRYVSEEIADTPATGIDPSLPIACIPLKIQDHVMGIIAVYSLFMKKPAFTDKDHELFDLLARHAATAIFSSRAYKNERKAPGVSWHDSLIILSLSLVFGIVFNLSSPHGIRLLPKVWSDERISTITPLSAMELYRTGDAFFIDAMPPVFFEKEHIKSAVNLPPALFDIMYMLELSEVEKGKEIVVYGRTVSSRYDEEVAQKLILRGHKNTRILEGGFSGWKKNGHPVGP